MEGSVTPSPFPHGLDFWCHHAELVVENWKTGCGGGCDGQHRFQVEMAGQAAMSRYLDQRPEVDRPSDKNVAEGIEFSPELNRQDPPYVYTRTHREYSFNY